MPLTGTIYKLNVKIKNQFYINVNLIVFLRTFIPDLHVRCNQNIFLLHDLVYQILLNHSVPSTRDFWRQ